MSVNSGNGSINALTETALGSYATYAQYVAQQIRGAPTGTVQEIPDNLKSLQAAIAILTDPVRINAAKVAVADQMNTQSGGPTFEDLSDRIANITLDTLAQGAGTLQLSILDPQWTLLNYEYPKGSGNTFIQADDTGYLWPPIDINFPEGTDCVWRLCQVRATIFTGDPNLTLTFEDRIVSWLREINSTMTGVFQSAPDATVGGFIRELVDGANSYLRGRQQVRGTDWQPIRLVELISPKDPNYQPPATVPTSDNPGAPLARQNPNKTKTGTTAAQKNYIDGINLAAPPSVQHTQMLHIEQQMNKKFEKLTGGVPGLGGFQP